MKPAQNSDFSLALEGTAGSCPIGEKWGMVLFDALAVYKKYTDLFAVEDVPEEERRQVARQVADAVLSALREGSHGQVSPARSPARPEKGCCH